MKKLAIFLLVGAVIGDLVAMLIAPSVLPWYATPGVGQAMCPCEETVRGTVHSFIRTQEIGASTGAILFVVAGILILRARAKRAKAAAPTEETAPKA